MFNAFGVLSLLIKKLIIMQQWKECKKHILEIIDEKNAKKNINFKKFQVCVLEMKIPFKPQNNGENM